MTRDGAIDNWIVNTARDERQPAWLAEGDRAALDGQRARGQNQLLRSNVLPVQLREVDEVALSELGFRLGSPIPEDPLFRYGWPPAGWEMRPTPHVLWSHVIDHEGDAWFQLFYDAAFHRRQAFLIPAFPAT